MILDVLTSYYERNRNSEVKGYAHQIQLLAHHSYMGREEAGGWAGEFTRTLLMIAAQDTAKRSNHWDNPDNRWWQGACSALFDIVSSGHLCETVRAGNEHFDEHLAPGFYRYIKARLVAVGKMGSHKTAYGRIEDEMLALIDEHERLIEDAVKPAAAEVHEYGPDWARSFIALNIAGDARALRKRTLDKIRLELADMGLVSRSDGLKLLSKSGGMIMMR